VTGGVTIAWQGVVVNGGMTVTGDAYLQTAVSTYSDKRLKDNITDIPHGALSKILTLRGVYYSWKCHEQNHDTTCKNQVCHDKSKSTELGVIAQDVSKVLPEAVHTSKPKICPNGSSVCDTGYMYVSYDKLIPLLVKAVQELDQLVSEYLESDKIDVNSIKLNNADKISIVKGSSLNNIETSEERVDEPINEFNIDDYENRLMNLFEVNDDIKRRILQLKQQSIKKIPQE
jgi:Chaperone of endosialidase